MSTAEGEVSRLSGVMKRFVPDTALRDESFAIDRCEVVGLLRDDGACKSTQVKVMSGGVPMPSGNYLWQGDMLQHVPLPSPSAEAIFQDSALVHTMSITRNVFAGRKITAEFLDSVVGIEGFKSAKHMVMFLSGGRRWPSRERSTSSGACSSVTNRRVLSQSAHRGATRLLHLKGEGVSSVLTTHDLHHAFKVRDRHILMNHGTKYCYRDPKTGMLSGDTLPVDLAANAESLGADVLRVKSIDEFRDALAAARASTRTTAIHIETDMFAPVPSSQSWWDVPVSEVAQLESTQKARRTYETHKSEQRPFLRPSE